MSPYLHKTPGARRPTQDGGGDSDPDLPPDSSAPSSPLQREQDSPAPQPQDTMDNHTLSHGVPVTVEVLSQHLTALHERLSNTIADAIKTALKDIQADVINLGERTDHLENSLDELIQNHNMLEGENKALKDELALLKLHAEDLENRSRRQNLRIRGISEEIGPQNIRPFLRSLFSTINPELPAEAWHFDRAHRALGARPANVTTPRDILVCMHYFESKESIMANTRNTNYVEHQGHKIQIFNDLSPITLNIRRDLRPVTQTLREHKIAYRWGL
ncbi:hypothetical protein XENTR_v10003932 [Xenopus tropicalis]|nr:hypothetical protein XENTR_v10003932 [Xenopus tropicalis]